MSEVNHNVFIRQSLNTRLGGADQEGDVECPGTALMRFATATVECCEGGSFRGRSEMEKYRRPRQARAVTGAFEIDALFPEVDGVTLDYRGYDGVPVRTHFRFTRTGKISLTACAPIRAAA